jgi:N utilization substance protein A
MKSDFLLAITQLSAEKNLPKEVVIEAVEAALASAYRKDKFTANQNIEVKINPANGKVEVWAEKMVVEHPLDTRSEISLDEARKVKPDAQLEETVMMEDTPHDAGRIAAQTAKQVILQRLHEAEHSAVFEEFADKEGDIVTGVIRRVESRQIFIDLGRTEAILPAVEQAHNETYRVGQRLKVYLLEVVRTSRGPRVVVSRSHPNLLRQLFELEVPEVLNGVVEIKSIAREAGNRSKVAVAARQEGIDPVGCCVGLRGIRIQNIVSELNGEKIDVVLWSPDARVFIANALSPARVLDVRLDEEEGIATVVVPDNQLSLAIGKEGQNVRLAAKLTEWRVDIKSASAAEAEKEAVAPSAEAEEEEAVEVSEEAPVEVPVAVNAVSEPAEAVEPLPALDTTLVPPAVAFEPPVMPEKTELRFAEDTMMPEPPKPAAQSRKKKKKSGRDKDSIEDGVKLRKRRRRVEIDIDEDEEEGY